MSCKKDIFNFLDRNREVFINIDKHYTISLMVHELKITNTKAMEYYKIWKAKLYDCDVEELHRQKFKIPSFHFLEFKGNLVGKNGTYRRMKKKDMLLTNGKAYINFANYNELLLFVDELLAAYQKMEV